MLHGEVQNLNVSFNMGTNMNEKVVKIGICVNFVLWKLHYQQGVVLKVNVLKINPDKFIINELKNTGSNRILKTEKRNTNKIR